jgi:hypothetical protein
MYRLIPLVLLTLLTGCVSVDYAGRSYAPTATVDVFYALGDVKRPYEVMGTAEARAGAGTPLADFEAELVKQAQTRGADAIVIERSEFIVTGEQTQASGSASSRPDRSSSGGLVKPRSGSRDRSDTRWEESSSTTITRERLITTRFLKYLQPAPAPR